MKKLFASLAVILVALFIFAPLNGSAFASEAVSTPAEVISTPHVVATQDVWLYDISGNKLFLIPSSYYAQISSMDDYYYFVSFNGTNGRVKKDEVNTLGYHAVATGTITDIKISPSYAEFSALYLKATPDLGGANIAEIPTSAPFTFLGKYPVEDELWYAVKFEQFFGYVKATRTNSPEINFTPFTPEVPEATVSAEPTEEASTPTKILGDLDESNSVLKIVLIIGLIIPAVIVIFLIFRPIEKKRAR